MHTLGRGLLRQLCLDRQGAVVCVPRLEVVFGGVAGDKSAELGIGEPSRSGRIFGVKGQEPV